MFHTGPNDENKPPLLQDGRRSWIRFEIAVELPFFIVAIREDMNSRNDAPSFTRTLILGEVEDVFELAKQQNDLISIQSVALMSPGCINKSGDYQHAQLTEIWEDDEDGGLKFVLCDGSSMTYPEGAPEADMKLVFRL